MSFLVAGFYRYSGSSVFSVWVVARRAAVMEVISPHRMSTAERLRRILVVIVEVKLSFSRGKLKVVCMLLVGIGAAMCRLYF